MMAIKHGIWRKVLFVSVAAVCGWRHALSMARGIHRGNVA